MINAIIINISSAKVSTIAVLDIFRKHKNENDGMDKQVWLERLFIKRLSHYGRIGTDCVIIRLHECHNMDEWTLRIL